ncbi:cell cycle checkpoint protein RAD1-like isoform X1 [Amphibalanus amphitrite]|uniref:cell cycle checkpoint protein RAD1-like isoform X1 n=1 Tax=Amphibalanus amphitrite TaxID=1232801 RepID=UPI001C9234C4|nr:cell cycle checkpoint protein RAD1-like isoform X1 [Amphibalanus amphitrite]XP_043226757.1 cell cycle checkpoint protein RAD1-like isoform X1 [Amphibalanus amphitrite]
MLDTQDSDEDKQNVLVAKIDNVKNVSQLLKAVHFKESAVVVVTSDGLKVTVEDSKCVQANAFIQADMFQQFVLSQETLSFKINLSVLLECLNIFGSGGTAGATTALKMCYAGDGHPLVIVLEESGVLTDCSIKTQLPEDTMDFNFNSSDVVNKTIIRSDCLREALAEMDGDCDLMELVFCPTPPLLQFAAVGAGIESKVEVAGDSDLVELFQCPRTSTSRYRLALMKLSLKPLAQSQKVSLRTDARGFLCLQYMIKTDDGHICFVEFFMVTGVGGSWAGS